MNSSSYNDNRKTDRGDINTPSVTPILAGWFASGMLENREDDVVQLGGVPIDQLSCLGRMVNMESLSSKVFIKIEDGTGIIDCVIHKRIDEEIPRLLQGVDFNREGLYLKIVFSPQVYKGKITNVVNQVTQIDEMNAITYHMLSVVYTIRFKDEGNTVNLRYDQYVKALKMKNSGNRASVGGRNRGSVGNGGRGGTANRNEQQASVANLKNNVLEALRSLKSQDHGGDLTFNQIRNKAPKGTNPASLKKVLDTLVNEGLLFEEDDKYDLL